MKLKPETDGRIRLHLAPAKTWLVTYGRASREAGSGKTYQVPGSRTLVAQIEGPWQGNRLNPNSLILDFARYSTDNGKTFSQQEPVIGIHQRLTKKQYKGNLMLKYEFTVADVPTNYSLVLEQPHLYQILVNGRKVNFVGKEYYHDHALRSQKITGTMKQGINEIVLSLNYVAPEPASLDAMKRYGTEIESVYLTGDFAVSVTPGEPVIQSQRNSLHIFAEKPVHTVKRFAITREQDRFEGDLVDQGYPFYAGSFLLENAITIEKGQADKGKRYFLTFPSFEAIVVKVRVNGKEFAPLMYSPWETEITEAVREGSNQVEVELTNSLRNLMGPHHHPGGELTAVGPVSFTGNPGWPSNTGGQPDWYDIRLKRKPAMWSDDYYLVPFGLLEPVEIVTSDE